MNILLKEDDAVVSGGLIHIRVVSVLVNNPAVTDTINQLLSRLASAIAAQQRFIANAAHKLRTPLAGLKL